MNTLVKMHKTMNISIKRIVTAFLLLFFTSFTCVMAQKDDSGATFTVQGDLLKMVDLTATCGFLPYTSYGVYTGAKTNDGFAVTNVALKGSTAIKFSDSFSLPIFAQAIWNPRMEDAHLVFGISLRPW